MNGYLTSMAALLQVLLLFWGGGTGVVNIYDARDSHDGPVHQCMRRDIVRVFFRGSGIRMQKIPLLDWFYAINQYDNLLIFY